MTPGSRSAGHHRWLGFAFGTLCAVIWGLQSVVSRQSVIDDLTAGDVTVLRFITGGLLLLPIAWRYGSFPVGQLGWGRALALTVLAGAPYSLILVGGVAFAPALHSSVLAPGLIPLIATLLAWQILGERPAIAKLAGLGLIALGLALFAWEALAGAPAREGAWRGDLLFVLAACMWAVFGLVSKRWGADPIQSTAAICVLSLLTLPLWAPLLPMRLWQASLSAIALQAVYQGIIVGVLSLVFYTRAVALLGAVGAALFLPLMPIVTAIAGIVWLGEWPSAQEILGMVVVMAGMALALRAR
jgi:drug/metabolite transporter (DMT)-like permease